MKLKATKKQVISSYDKVICCGYGSLQALLSRRDPIAYTGGVYGWNSDVYDVGGVAICTGYRPFGNVKPDYETVRSFETRAESIRNSYRDIVDYGARYAAITAALNSLLKDFIQAVTA